MYISKCLTIELLAIIIYSIFALNKSWLTLNSYLTMEVFVLPVRKMEYIRVKLKLSCHTNEIKILDALGLPRRRYSIFLVFTVYVMGPQFNISSEFFSFSVTVG